MGRLSLGIKALQTFVYALAFCGGVVVLGIYSYFLAIQSTHHAGIPTKHKAIEGISGAGVLYTIFAVILTCFLGGIPFFAFLAIILDILFIGGFIAIAVETRDGASSCKADFLNTPLGSGASTTHQGRNGAIYSASLHTICKLETAVFAVAIITAFLFLVAALLQLALGRRHQKDKRYGPSPANGYTSGTGKKSWFKRRGARAGHDRTIKDAEVGAIPAGGVAATNGHHHTNGRDSYNTNTTDSYVGNKYENNQYANETSAVPTAGGYHTAPAGTGVNPYGYDNTRSHGTAL